MHRFVYADGVASSIFLATFDICVLIIEIMKQENVMNRLYEESNDTELTNVVNGANISAIWNKFLT